MKQYYRKDTKTIGFSKKCFAHACSQWQRFRNFVGAMAGLYLHIPFCRSRCAYCDFFSTLRLDRASRYVNALIAEAALRVGELSGEPVTTLYVGGGTPSLLSSRLWHRLVTGLRDAVDLSGVLEFTVEVNPDDVDDALAATLVAVGCNRVSMGVQSFIDSELRAVNRRHTSRQAVDAVSTLRRAGVANMSLDLIYGLPGQTLDTWRQSLGRAVDLGAEHLSAYNLTFEPGTPLWRQRERGELTEADDETCLRLYQCLVDTLGAAGYEHYEISNFALPGYRSRHNSSYWADVPYLGLGAAAHSYDGAVRRHNPASLTGYFEAVESGRSAAVPEVLTVDERFDEMVMVRLRTREGIDLDEVVNRFDRQRCDRLLADARPHLLAGRLLLDDKRLRLAAAGVMVSDDIIVDLMS